MTDVGGVVDAETRRALPPYVLERLASSSCATLMVRFAVAFADVGVR